MITAAGVALYEQTLPEPNRYVMVAAIAVLMMGALWLSSKIPSKHKNDQDDDASERG